MFEALIDLIKSIYGKGPVPLHAPVLNDEDRRKVLEAIDSGFVSSVGPHVTQFEKELSEYTGSNHVVAVVNGTSALHLALIASGVEKGDIVLTQGLTFVATANAIKYLDAEPVFLDSDVDTLGLSPISLGNYLETFAERRPNGCFHKINQRRIRACVPMHVFGHPVRLLEILKICSFWGINVIEDAAEALGSKIDDHQAGTMAPIGILSFNGNKIITTGGGGALLIKDDLLAQKVRHLSTTAKKPHRWEFHHDQLGYNYRLPNLNAALGCSQLKRLDSFLEIKKSIAKKYESFFKQYSNVEFFIGPDSTTPNYWLNAVLVENREVREFWLDRLNNEGIMCRPAWELMSDLPMYKESFNDGLINARNLVNRLVNLPSGVPS